MSILIFAPLTLAAVLLERPQRLKLYRKRAGRVFGYGRPAPEFLKERRAVKA